MLTLADRLRKEGRIEGRQEGLLEGQQKGIQLGELQGKLKLARELMKNGVSIDILVNSTGLSREKIENFALQND